MYPLVISPDIEAWATGWLRAALDARPEAYAADVWVDNKVPVTRRDRMVIVRRDGGPRQDLLYSVPRLGINVWATTEADATDLANLVEALLLTVRATNPVESVTSLSGPTPIPDESTQSRRYLTVELLTRGATS